jgi:hypothetical protein
MRVGVALLALAASAVMVEAATPIAKKKTIVRKKRKKPAQKAVARHAPDGRVYYPKSNMPPGFSWPPNKAMKKASSTCEHALDEAGIKWHAAEREGEIVDPVVVPAMELGGIKYTSTYKKPPFTMDCQLVRTLDLIGPELHKLGVREIKFGSIYRNTLVRAHGVTKPILSRHALGLAMDIKSFVDDSGREASVELDYLKGDTLLHGIEDAINKSNQFRIVLTPGNDPISHYDHFHVEASVDFTAFR